MSSVKDYQIKRNHYLSLLLLLPVAAAVIAEYLTILSSYANSTYAIESLYPIMIMAEIATALLVAVFLLGFYLKGRISMYILDAMRVAAVILLSLCLYRVLDERATLMGYVWFSDLESGNANSVAALNYGVAAAALYAFSALLSAATGAIELVSAKKALRTRESVEAEIEELQKELKNMG